MDHLDESAEHFTVDKEDGRCFASVVKDLKDDDDYRHMVKHANAMLDYVYHDFDLDVTVQDLYIIAANVLSRYYDLKSRIVLEIGVVPLEPELEEVQN